MPATPMDEVMMRRALALAAEAARAGEAPVGAIVYRHETGDVLGEGLNRRERDADPSAHAEVVAARAAAARLGRWRLDGCSMAVTLEPCPMCAGLIVNARIARVVYGADDPKAGAARTLLRLCDDPRLNHRAEVIAGVLAEPCARMLREFFRARRGDQPDAREPS